MSEDLAHKIPIACPHCESSRQVSSSIIGRLVRCATCHKAFPATELQEPAAFTLDLNLEPMNIIEDFFNEIGDKEMIDFVRETRSANGDKR